MSECWCPCQLQRAQSKALGEPEGAAGVSEVPWNLLALKNGEASAGHLIVVRPRDQHSGGGSYRISLRLCACSIPVCQTVCRVTGQEGPGLFCLLVLLIIETVVFLS